MTVSVPVMTVSELNRNVRVWLEQDMGEVCIEGEISNLSKPSSGHYYFTLKDASAQLRCVFFRNHHPRYNGTPLKNGQHVQACGTLSLYEARGDFQLIIEIIKEVGEGDLYRQFELLKQKLAALGLFNPTRKKPLPKYPLTIGVITSASAAALQDIITTISRRFPVAQIILYPSEVQGKFAAQQLIHSILKANEDSRCEVLILARGGGSIEDLWPFNDERLAHCIANSRLPIVSGVGHETDFTIADFVADLRAATPTAAAEAITPNFTDLLAYFQGQQLRMQAAISRILDHKRLLLQHEVRKVMSPHHRMVQYWQTLDYLSSHLNRGIRHLLLQQKQRLQIVHTRLQSKNPEVKIQQAKHSVFHFEKNLRQSLFAQLEKNRRHLQALLTTLHAVSPLATLHRGYAIATHRNKVLFDSQTLNVGDEIHVRLAKGQLTAHVTSKGD